MTTVRVSDTLSFDLNLQDRAILSAALQTQREKVCQHSEVVYDHARAALAIENDDCEALYRLHTNLHREWIRIGELLELITAAERITVRQETLAAVPALGEAGGGDDNLLPGPPPSATAEGGS